METIIDTVEACTLEVDDVTEFGTVQLVIEYDGYVIVVFEDEESKHFDDFELVNLYGIVYAESV